MTLKNFRENIWWQLGFLLLLAVVCGLILGVVFYVSSLNKPSDTFDASIYKTVYGENYTYVLDTNFKGKTETLSNKGGLVTSEEKVNVNDGAKIVKFSANSGYGKFEMCIVVKNNSAEYIYFTNKGGSSVYLEGFYPINNNKLMVADLVSASAGATYTYNALTKAIQMAQNA